MDLKPRIYNTEHDVGICKNKEVSMVPSYLVPSALLTNWILH